MDTKSIPLLDIPVDYIMGDDVTASLLNEYGRFPCHIKAMIFGVVVRGSVRAKVNLSELTVQEGELFVLLPNTFIFLQEASEDTLVYFLGFSNNFVERSGLMRQLTQYYDAMVASPIIHVKSDVSNIFKETILLLVHAAQMENTLLSSEVMLSIISIIAQILVPLYRGQETENGPRHATRAAEITHDFGALVMQHYQKEHRVNYYADQLHLCLPYLCSVIKEETGQTATQVINKAIITDAKSQLKGTDAQIKVIAYSLGFENLSFFNKFFKTQTGLTPKQYRES